MSKLFTVAGTSVKNAVTKFRTANDLAFRIKQLNRDGQTEINLIELPTPMTKIDAARFCLTHESFTDLLSQIAINNALGEEQAPAVIKTVAVEAPEAPVVEEVTAEHTASKPEIEELMPVLEADDDYADIMEIAIETLCEA